MVVGNLCNAFPVTEKDDFAAADDDFPVTLFYAYFSSLTGGLNTSNTSVFVTSAEAHFYRCKLSESPCSDGTSMYEKIPAQGSLDDGHSPHATGYA